MRGGRGTESFYCFEVSYAVLACPSCNVGPVRRSSVGKLEFKVTEIFSNIQFVPRSKHCPPRL